MPHTGHFTNLLIYSSDLLSTRLPSIGGIRAFLVDVEVWNDEADELQFLVTHSF